MQAPSPGSPPELITVPQTISVGAVFNHQDETLSPQRVNSAASSVEKQPEDVVMTSGESAICSSDANLDPQTQARLEADKRAVYKHPLFPLLALLFEKCEIATQCAEISSSESFNLDIQAFVQHQERDGKPIFSEDHDVDGLMVKAIQVLRIHLLELEKVQELCKDFCNRYITCLKNKMQSENLLRTDYPGLANSNGGASCSSPSSDSNSSPNSFTMNGNSNGSNSQGADSNNCFVRIQPKISQVPLQPSTVNNSVSMTSVSSNQLVSGCKVYQMVQTPQGIVAQPIQVTPLVVHGSTPMSQIGTTVPPLSSEQRIQAIAPRNLSMLGSGDEDDDEMSNKRKQKRGVLPKLATSIMRSWLFQHLVHPYPTEDEKRQLATQTNLTLLQVNNWFINARRRILQPMLDSSSNESSHKAKKPKSQSSRCVQRFWPESIASIQPQVGVGSGGPNSAATSAAGSSAADLENMAADQSNGASDEGDAFVDNCSSDGAVPLDSNGSVSAGSLSDGGSSVDESLAFNGTAAPDK